MKAIKKLFKAILWIAAILVLAILLLPLWIGPVAKFAADRAVSKTTGTEFRLGEFSLNQYTGFLHIGDVRLQNPERFFKPSEKSAKPVSEVKGEGVLGTVAAHAGNALAAAGDAAGAVVDAVVSSETNAVTLGSLDVAFSPLSALTDTVKIGEIKIADLFFYGDLTFSNIREISANASGDGEKKEEEKKPEEKSEGGKKVQIDRVFITGAKIQWGHVAVPLPDIEIKDIGKDSGGTDRKGAIEKIVAGVCDAADKVCAGAGTALKVAIDGADAAAGAIGGAIDAAGGAVGAAADAASAAAGAAAEKVGGAVDSVKNLFK